MPQEGKVHKHVSKRHLYRCATEQTKIDIQLLLTKVQSSIKDTNGQWVRDIANDNFQGNDNCKTKTHT